MPCSRADAQGAASAVRRPGGPHPTVASRDRTPPPRLVHLVTAVGAACLAVCCSQPCERDRDCPVPQVCSAGRCGTNPVGDADDADHGRDAQGEDATGIDGADADRPGVAAILVSRYEVSQDLACDIDGDGTPDNSFAAVHPALAGMFEAVFQDAMRAQTSVFALDVHRVRDPVTPESAPFDGAFVGAIDCDGDLSDNDSPGEVVDAIRGYYDAEGAPVFPCRGTLEEGELRASVDQIPVLFSPPVFFRQVVLQGHLTAGLSRFERAHICAYFIPRELAGITNRRFPGVTALDIVVAPGLALGIPGEPGAQPDIDVDGDGLESLVADEAGHVTLCMDGDGTFLPSTETTPCTSLPEIADGYSVVARGEGVSARLLLPGAAGEACPESGTRP